MTLPVFDASAVSKLLPLSTCIDLMTEVQAAISSGAVTPPLRSAMSLAEPDNQLLIMPGFLEEPAVFGAKLLSLYPRNAAPTAPDPVIQGYVLLFDGDAGTPLALVEASSLTAIRTAAASAAATRVLARPEAGTLALLGYGVQAGAHLGAMLEVRPVLEVRVWGPDPGRARAFATREARNGLLVRAMPTAESAVRGADLICAVSAAKTPILQGDWLQPGCHVNLVGAFTADTREADGVSLARARIFTEVQAFAMAEAGDILLAIAEGHISADDIAGEIGSVHNGDLVGRESAQQITLYKSLGNTAQDLIAAHRVYRQGSA